MVISTAWIEKSALGAETDRISKGKRSTRRDQGKRKKVSGGADYYNISGVWD